MIKVSVMYPNGPQATFDHGYYCSQHMPMVKARLGDALKFYTVDKGLSGAAPGSLPAYAAAGHLHLESVEVFQSAFGPHAQEIMADIPNYTNITPVIQISEVIAEA